MDSAALAKLPPILHVDLHWLLTGEPSPNVVAFWTIVSGTSRHLLVLTLNKLSEEENAIRRRLAEASHPDLIHVRLADLEKVQQHMKAVTSLLQWYQRKPEELLGPDGFIRGEGLPGPGGFTRPEDLPK